MKRLSALIIVLAACSYQARSQVLISLLLGDDLNSGKLEFGLEGGFNYATIDQSGPVEWDLNAHLGFYFDFLLNENLYLNTGVRVKNTVGATGIPVYPTGDPDLDLVFAGGFVERRLNYFYVPVMMKYMFQNQFFIEGGIQIGLRYKAYDNFTQTVYSNDDLVFRLNIKDQTHPIDMGLSLGGGYHITKNTGMTIALIYYYGLTNIYNDGRQGKNRSAYLSLFIPIGKGKAAAKAAAKEAAGN